MVRCAILAVLIALSVLDAATARGDVLFDSSRAYSVASGMGAIVDAGDFNGDGKADLVSVARYADGPVSVLIARGDGTFEKTTTVSAGGLSLATGDLNGDGKLDLALPGFSNVATILFGNGDGTFDPPVGVGGGYGGGAPGGVMSIAVAQLGGADPGLDIALTNSNGLQVLLGKGDGTFAPPTTYTGWDASELVAGDFTEDGHRDIVLTRFIGGDTNWIAVLPGSATGALGTAIKTTVENGLGSPVVTDDDGDGLLDIVSADRSMFGTSVTLYYGTGEGAFEFPVEADFGARASRVGVGHFDKDDNPDIAANTFDNYLVVWLATGLFAESRYSDVLADSPAGMVVTDANGDGADDIATATFSSGKVIVSLNAPGVQASPANLSFAPQTVGSTAVAQTITVTNTGIPALRISGVSVEGAAASDFTAGGNCHGAAVSAGAACTIAAGFTPAAAGARTATLLITGNQAGSPTRLPLAGNGIVPSGAVITPAPADTTPPTLSLKLRRDRLAKVLDRGLRLSISCSEACNVRASGRISARTARRLNLSRSRKPFVVGRSRAAVPAGGPTTLRLRLSRKATRALSKRRAIRLTVAVTAMDAAGNKASTQQKLRLRR